MALSQSNNHKFQSGELVTSTKLNNVKVVQTDTATNNDGFTGSAGQLTFDTTNIISCDFMMVQLKEVRRLLLVDRVESLLPILQTMRLPRLRLQMGISSHAKIADDAMSLR